MGGSWGGLSTKIHALVDAEGLPGRIALTPGQASDVLGADMFLNHLAAGSVLLVTRDMIPTGSEKRPRLRTRRQTFPINPIARKSTALAKCSIKSATRLKVSSTISNSSSVSPPATKNLAQTSWR